MRILLINYEYPPLGGGGGVAACKLAEAWVQQGHEVDVVTTHYRGLALQETQKGVHIFRVPVLNRKDLATATLFSMVSFPYLAKKIVRKLFKQKNYDVIQTHFAVPSGPLGIWASKKFKVPQVLFIHGGDIYDPSKKLSPHRWGIFRGVVRRILNQSQKVLCQSENTRQNAMKFYGYEKPIAVVPLGFEPPQTLPLKTRKDLGFDLEAYYLIGVGRMVRRKNFDLLIACLKNLPERIRLVLVGDGPEEKNLKALAENLGLQDRVIFAGRLDEEEKYACLINADLYVLSSMHEGYGIVLQEAMEAGLPMVATNHGGQTDFLTEGENALLVNPGDEGALTRAILRAYENPALCKTMAANNRRQIKGYYIQNIAGEHIEIFKQVISEF